MTLATTCPRCKTSFRVVADQLKLRRGMVRCGVCQNVFNGLEHLRYVEALAGAVQTNESTPNQLAPPRPEPVKVNVPPIKVSSPPVSADLPSSVSSSSASNLPLTSLVASGPVNFAAPAFVSPSIVAPSVSTPSSLPEPSVGSFQAFNIAPPPIPASLSPASANAPLAAPPYSPLSDADLDDIYPSNRNPNTEFLNERGMGESTTLTRSDDDVHTAFFLPESVPAEMQAEVIQPPRSIQTSYAGNANAVAPASRGNQNANSVDEDAVDFFSSENSYGTTHDRASSWIRRALIGALILGLLIQVLLITRNWISIRLPSAQPTLDAMANLFGMKVEVPRNLSALTIESFDVQSQPARADILVVSAIVRNRSSYAVQWPAMELTLTGVDGRPILRKVLLPREYLNQAPTVYGVPGNSEHPIRIGLQIEPIEAKGFSANIFYP
jgi:predicted Zn finger-like uncharacterized protein